MARNCNCAGSTCGCNIMAGEGISIQGNGTASQPFVITNTGAQLSSALDVQDTLTLNLTKSGQGTAADPIVISGAVTLKMQQLSDVSNPGGVPLAGQRPIYVGTSGADGHWEFQYPFPPYTTAARPGAGTVPTGFAYFDTTLGKPVWRKNATTYVDATGATV